MPQSTAGRVLLSMIAATCVTLITNALDTSPTVSLVGATLAAAVPALITVGGDGIGLGVGVTAAALGLTAVVFTVVEAVTDRPRTFLEGSVQVPAGQQQPPPPPPPPPPGEPPPLPPPEPRSPASAEVGQAVGTLRQARISYNAPTTLRLGPSTEIQLLLSPRHTVRELKKMLSGIGERRGATVEFSDRMEAHLTGTNFKIEAIRAEDQLVNPERPTEWRWEVEATKTGTQRLYLTLSTFIAVDGDQTRYVIETYNTPLEIRVTWPDRVSSFFSHNWQWLWAVVFAPIAAWLYRSRERWLWRLRSPPPPSSPSS